MMLGFGLIVLLEPPVVSKFQLSRYWLQVKLKNLIHFVQFTSTAGK